MKTGTTLKLAMAALLLGVQLIGYAVFPANADNLTLVDYSVWETKNRSILDFNTIPNGTYLGNEFIGQGVLFGDHYGYTSVSDARPRVIDTPDQKQIDFGRGEWLDISFVNPISGVETTAQGFGVKYNSPADYDWVAFYGVNDNLLGIVNGTQGDNFKDNEWFLGVITQEAIGRVRVGADGWAFETYNYEVLRNDNPTPTTGTPEPATMLLLGAGIIGLVGLKKKVL